MKYSEKDLSRFINRALFIVGADKSYEQILAEESGIKGKKKPKDYKPYYLLFPWTEESQVEEYTKYLRKEVIKLNPKYTEREIDVDVAFLDCLTSLSEINIYTERVKLLETPLEEKKL